MTIESSHTHLENPQATVARFKQRSVQFGIQSSGLIYFTEIPCFVASSIIPEAEWLMASHYRGRVHGLSLPRRFTYLTHQIKLLVHFYERNMGSPHYRRLLPFPPLRC
jgi:hypothetical protein